MSYARLLHIWACTLKRERCRRCRQPILLGDDHGKQTHALAADAQPVDVHVDAVTQLRTNIYEPRAHHRCPVKKKRQRQAQAAATPRVVPRQESLL